MLSSTGTGDDPSRRYGTRARRYGMRGPERGHRIVLERRRHPSNQLPSALDPRTSPYIPHLDDGVPEAHKRASCMDAFTHAATPPRLDHGQARCGHRSMLEGALDSALLTWERLLMLRFSTTASYRILRYGAQYTSLAFGPLGPAGVTKSSPGIGRGLSRQPRVRAAFRQRNRATSMLTAIPAPPPAAFAGPHRRSCHRCP